MYKIIKDGAVLAMTEAPNYIKRTENGCFTLCQEPEAEGIAHAGAAFQLLGRPSMGGAVGAVMLEETDAGEEIRKTSEAGEIVFVTLTEAGSIDPGTAAEHADLFAAWAYPVNFSVGQIRRHGGKLYKCLTAHTSQADWAPDVATSLWVAIADPAEEWPAWSQPVGAHDAYAAGAKTTHKGDKWTSDVDGNVWEPGVYGWTKHTATEQAEV